MHSLPRPSTCQPGRSSLARSPPLHHRQRAANLTKVLRDSREAWPSPAALREPAGFLLFLDNGIYSYYGIGKQLTWSTSRTRSQRRLPPRRCDDFLASTGPTHRTRLWPCRLLARYGTRQQTALGLDRRTPGRRWARRSRSWRSPSARRIERRQLTAARGCSRPPAERLAGCSEGGTVHGPFFTPFSLVTQPVRAPRDFH